MKSTFSDALQHFFDSSMQNVHTCIPATIVDYDFSVQKASVLPSVKITLSDGTVLSQPIISNVPVIFPRSKNASLTFPLEKGDGVLLVFSERCLDNWLASNTDEVEEIINRRFDLTDAIAIVGLSSIVTQSLGTKDDLVLVYKNSSVKILKDGGINLNNSNCQINLSADGKFNISNNDENLLNIINDTLSACKSITVEGKPIDNIAAFDSLITRLGKLI